MQYLVRPANRAFRDMEPIYEFIEVGSSESAFAWFNGLAEAIHSFQRFRGRGAVIPEDGKLRHLLFGQNPNTYRIIYTLDKRKKAMNILHIRHGARDAVLT